MTENRKGRIKTIAHLIAQKMFGNRRKKNPEKIKVENQIEVEAVDGSKVPVQWKVLSEIDESDESKLVKITDKNVINSIMFMLPQLFHLGVTSNNVANNITAGGNVLYKAVIPAGAKLVTSKDMPNAVRGIYAGTKGVAGQASIVAAGGVNVAMNVMSSAMSIASVIVGQYYIRKVYKDMRIIIGNIEDVITFLDIEYKSRVLSLMTEVQKRIDYEAENLADENFRLEEVNGLLGIESECNKLLFHAESQLESIASFLPQKYEEYIQKVQKIDCWNKYQLILFNALTRIEDLIYSFNLGKKSYGQCYHLKTIHEKKIQQIKNDISLWHQKEWKILKINITEKHRQRVGIDGVIHAPLGWFKEKLNYLTIPDEIIQTIIDQTQSDDFLKNDEEDLFNKDIQIIVRDNVIYYLPEKKEFETEKGISEAEK